MKKKIVVIGGSGFIGSYLIEQLSGIYEISNLDKNKLDGCETIQCNICNKEELERKFPVTEWVVLLAAEHKDNVSPVSLYYDVNVGGTRNVLEVMKKKGIQKIIFTSTVAIYGLNKPNPDENFSPEPFNNYGKSKYQAEEILKAWYDENPTERTLLIIRPTVVFGPKNRGNVYTLLQQIMLGKFKMVGSGKNKKSMSYVGNLVAFIKYLLVNDANQYQVYNYADKPDLSTNELISTISKTINKPVQSFKIPYLIGYTAGLGFDILSKVTGKKFNISSVRIKKFCSTTQFSSDKVEATAFKAPYTLIEGLEITIKSLL